MAPRAAPPKPWSAEYMKSSALVVCCTCSTPIVQNSFCLVNLLRSKEFGCYLASWHHAACILLTEKKIRDPSFPQVGKITLLDNRKIRHWNDVEGAETLLWIDAVKLRKYINEEEVVGEYEVEKVGRFLPYCRSCNILAETGQVMIACTEAVGDGRFQRSLHPRWRHASCFFDEFPEAQVPGYTRPLRSETQAPIRALTNSSVRVCAQPGFDAVQWKAGVSGIGECSPKTFEDKREEAAKALAESVIAKPHFDLFSALRAEIPLRPSTHPQPTLHNPTHPFLYPFDMDSTTFNDLFEDGRGKKRNGGTDETSNKRQKTSGSEADAAVAIGKEVLDKTTSKENNSVAAVKQVSMVTQPLSKFEMQLQRLLKLKDELREHVSVEELREVLIANDQDDTGSPDELLERCADGMMFGALKSCSRCKCPMEFHAESYRCRGFITGSSVCKFTTLKPKRVSVNDYMIGEAYNNPYLIHWWTDHLSLGKVGPRVLAPGSSASPISAPTSAYAPSSSGAPTRASAPTSAGDPTSSDDFISADDSTSAGDFTSAGEFFLFRCMFVAIGKFSMIRQATLKDMVRAAGGTVRGGAQSLQDRSFLFCEGPCRAIVTTEKALDNDVLLDEIDYAQTKMKLVKESSIPIVREQFLLDCLKKRKLLPVDGYTLQLPRSIQWTEILNRPE